ARAGAAPPGAPGSSGPWTTRWGRRGGRVCLGLCVSGRGPGAPPPRGGQLGGEETRRIQASWGAPGGIGKPERWTQNIGEAWKALEGFLDGACAQGRP